MHATVCVQHDIQLIFVLMPIAKRTAVKKEIEIIRFPSRTHDKMPRVGKSARQRLRFGSFRTPRPRPLKIRPFWKKPESTLHIGHDIRLPAVIERRQSQIGHCQIQIVVIHPLQFCDIIRRQGQIIQPRNRQCHHKISQTHLMIPARQLNLCAIGINLLIQFFIQRLHGNLAPARGFFELGKQCPNVILPIGLHRLPVATARP